MFARALFGGEIYCICLKDLKKWLRLQYMMVELVIFGKMLGMGKLPN
jgi:hypothetical protein